MGGSSEGQYKETPGGEDRMLESETNKNKKKKKEHRVIFLCTLIAHNTIKFPEI